MKCNKVICGVVCLGCVIALILCGCSDNPADKASAQLAAVTQQAMAQANTALQNAAGPDGASADQADPAAIFTDARSKINQAISSTSASTDAVGQAYLASGNIASAQGLWLSASLPDRLEDINHLLGEISAAVRRSNDLLAEQDRFELSVREYQAQLADFHKLLNGDSAAPGLLARLDAQQKELASLEEQKKTQQDLAQQAGSNSDKIQEQADQLLQKAQAAAAEQEKHQLGQQAYQLLATREKYLSDAMTAADAVERLNSGIKTASQLIEDTQNQISSVQSRIAQLNESPLAKQAQQRQQDIASAFESSNKQIAELTASFEKLSSDYIAASDQVVSILSQAGDDYKEVRSDAALPAARSALADSSAYLANLYTDRLWFENFMTSRFQPIVAGASEKTRAILNPAVEKFAQAAEQYQQKAMEYFDLALQEYEDMDRFMSGYGEEFACDVLKSHLLALKGKIDLVQSISGDQQLLEPLRQKTGQLMEQGSKFGNKFSRSFTVKLVENKPFVPTLSVDNSALYEGIRNQFQAWKKLKGKNQETEVNRLIGYAAQKKQEINDPEFDKAIDPEVEQLKQAIAKGFAQTSVVKNDPNRR